MDEQVVQSMAKWPNVPAVFGWLRLDPRGQWWLIQRDRPDFTEALHGAGSTLSSPPILEFLLRNYAADSLGRWYWQNGPQRVYVSLDRAPWVVRLDEDAECAAALNATDTRGHAIGAISRAVLGSLDGCLYLQAAQGPCAIDDRHLVRLADRLQSTHDGWQLNIGTRVRPHYLPVEESESPDKIMGFVRHPGEHV
jgi:Protein of unknown function (DUF2946)